MFVKDSLSSSLKTLKSRTYFSKNKIIIILSILLVIFLLAIILLIIFFYYTSDINEHQLKIIKILIEHDSVITGIKSSFFVEFIYKEFDINNLVYLSKWDFSTAVRLLETIVP